MILIRCHEATNHMDRGDPLASMDVLANLKSDMTLVVAN